MSCFRALTDTNETRDPPDPDNQAGFPAVSYRAALISLPADPRGLRQDPAARFAAGIFMRRRCANPAGAPVLWKCLSPGTTCGGCSSPQICHLKLKPL